MREAWTFGLVVLLASVAGFLAVESHLLTQRLRVPAPAWFLLAAASAVQFVPGLVRPDSRDVQRVVTVALLLILFDGGMNIGSRRLRSSAVPVVSLGVFGTVGTVAGAAVLVHVLVGVSWYLSVLVATAVAPTDPAVVFSVLGQREVEGRVGTILEGESGANDPVGIALMAALLAAGSLSPGAVVTVADTFALQMIIGGIVGVVGGRLLLVVLRWPLPGEGLYPVRALVGAGVLFGLATVAHGSGFLAVFLAGIVMGDERAPFKREITRFHIALASLAEVIAFASLGFTVRLDVLTRLDVLLPGVGIGLLLALLVRPVVTLPLLLPTRLRPQERGFVMFAGLKGAVPLLLGSLLVPGRSGQRLYGLVVVIVLVSVLGQGSLVPTVARLLRIQMRFVEPKPYALGVRLRQEPASARHLSVAPGSPADGQTISRLTQLPDGAWVSLLLRDGTLIPVHGDTRLHVGDQILVVTDGDEDMSTIHALFTEPAQPEQDSHPDRPDY